MLQFPFCYHIHPVPFHHSHAANARNEDQDVSFPSSLSYDPSKESSGASGDGSLSDFGIQCCFFLLPISLETRYFRCKQNLMIAHSNVGRSL